jgi:selenocysteine-specific elongation factor
VFLIEGAQIIDLMILVIDIEKGVQTQTSECLIIGEICCDKLIIVLNKLDLIEEAKREAFVEKMKKKLRKTLENTKFAACSIVATSAQQAIVSLFSKL